MSIQTCVQIGPGNTNHLIPHDKNQIMEEAGFLVGRTFTAALNLHLSLQGGLNFWIHVLGDLDSVYILSHLIVHRKPYEVV